MKIGFTGAQGTGKTTLVNHLLTHLDDKDYHTHTNVARILSRELPLFNINRDANFTSQSAISGSVCIDVLTHPKIVTDRTIIDTLAYAAVCDNISKVQLRELIDTYASVVKYYDYVFYTPIEFEATSDGTRDIDVVYQQRVDDAICMFLNDLGVNFSRLTGSVSERIDTILTTIKHGHAV